MPAFIQNKGQVFDQFGRPNNSVLYLCQTLGLNVHLKANSFSYDTYTIKREKRNVSQTIQKFEKAIVFDSFQVNFHRVDIVPIDANPHPRIITENPSASELNFYNGITSQSGVTTVKDYKRVIYKDLYAGIDMVFEVISNAGAKEIEYYFIVKPGADVNQIKLQYRGTLGSSIKQGSIELRLSTGKLLEKLPASYISSVPDFDLDQLLKQEKIKVAYKKFNESTYGFTAGVYDKSKTLIIDPTPDVLWSTYLGGALQEQAFAVSTDAANNVLLTGWTTSLTSIATVGAFQSVYGGGPGDAFIAKFNSGGALLWSTYFGGMENDAAYGIDSDVNGNIIAVGWTSSSAGIATPGTHQPVKAGDLMSTDAFVVKFSSNGTRLWGTYFGGDDVEQALEIDTDQGNNIFVTGFTASFNGISTPGSHQINYGGGVSSIDGFLAKFNANGALQWGTYYGGGESDGCSNLEVDHNNNILITGSTQSNTNIASLGAHQTTLNGENDGFLAKFNTIGQRLWGTYIGGSGGEACSGVAVDVNDNVFLNGWTIFSADGIATTGAHQSSNNGLHDNFLIKFNGSGARQWGTYYGGEGEELLFGEIVCDGSNVYIAHATYSQNGISTPGTYQPSFGGVWDTYIAKFNNNGVRQWGTYFGGEGDDETWDMALDASGNILLSGFTSSTTGIASCGAYQSTFAGIWDAFLAKFAQQPTVLPTVVITSNDEGPFCAGSPVSFTAAVNNAGPDYSLQWQVNDNSMGISGNFFTSNNLLNGDRVTCILTVLATSCNGSAAIDTSNTIFIALTAPSTPSINILSSATTICTGSTVNFTAQSLNSGTAPVYQWQLNGINIGGNTPLFSTSSLSHGDVVSCILTSSSTCLTTPIAISNEIKISVTAITLPVITIGNSIDNICKGNPVVFTAQITNAGTAIYQWKVNGNNAGTNNETFISKTLANGDIVSCMLTTSIANCNTTTSVFSNTIPILVRDTAIINLLPSDTAIFVGGAAQLRAAIIGNLDRFQWAPATGLNTTASLMPVSTPSTTTTYELRVWDTNGCESFAKAVVRVLKTIQMPNAFTPNGDGKNDVFRIPSGVYFNLSNFEIYDRWGNRVFATNDLSKGWDGNFNGKKMSVGSYVYYVKGKDDKGPITLKGNLLLIR